MQNSDNLTAQIGELKSILENSQTPIVLDGHPWTKSLVVHELIAREPALQEKSPGYQLVYALSQLFKELMPATPPRNGKRLDTRWGQYGTLAAQYFAPFVYGCASPKSLRDTWGSIDQSIALFVFSGQSENLADEGQLARYKMIGNDLDFTPKSTVSDWSRAGLKSLTEVLLQHEERLSNTLNTASPLLSPLASPAPREQDQVASSARALSAVKPNRRAVFFRRFVGWGLVALLVGFVFLVGLKAWRIYGLLKVVESDARALQNISSSLLYDQKEMTDAGLRIDQLRKGLLELRAETGSLIGLGEQLSWVPVYGGDLASAGDLLELAINLTTAAQDGYQGTRPIITAVTHSENTPSPGDLAKLLQASQADFESAQAFLAKAVSARQEIDPAKLSPTLQDIVRNKIDPLLPLLDQGLRAAVALPKLLGATREGSQTYLVLIQNEDELRATGGFITAVGTVVVKDGELLSYNIESSDLQEDLSKPYPLPPWQMQQYMDIPILVLRDANWYVDFPTAAGWIEYLYAYKHAFSVDGVIAFDQQFISLLLQVTGPVDVPGVSAPVTAENLFGYLRDAKVQYAAGQPLDRKAFLNDLTQPLLKKLLAGKGFSGKSLLDAVYQGLNQHHLLLQLDDPGVAAILAQNNWDGAIRPGDGDFLMVVDSNVGYNKTNAVIDTQIDYQVDLTDLAAPKTALTVQHQNKASKRAPCIQWGYIDPTDKNYPIERCYWDYMRVYLPLDTRLASSKVQPIAAKAMILQKNVPAQVDILDPQDEQLEGLQGFGALLLVPVGTSRESSFTFSLPSRIVTRLPDSSYVYRLIVRKQPGTRNTPFHLNILLPAGASILSLSQPLKQAGSSLDYEFGLLVDFSLEIHFTVP